MENSVVLLGYMLFRVETVPLLCHVLLTSSYFKTTANETRKYR